MMYIIAGIVGGFIVLLGIRFSEKRILMKFLFKIFYVFRDYVLKLGAELFEKGKDIAAESRLEYEKEKAAQREAKME